MSLAVVLAVIAVVLVLVLVLITVIRSIVTSVRDGGRILTVMMTAATEYKNPDERQNHKENDAAHTTSKKGL